MIAFYFVCHEIKYLKNIETIDIKKLRYSQSPENVWMTKRALSIGFTNIFEFILKKMKIKYKHIQGNCKLIPNNNYKYLLNTNSSANTIDTKLNTTEDEVQKGSRLINHCWDVIYINRDWYFVDTLLG